MFLCVIFWASQPVFEFIAGRLICSGSGQYSLLNAISVWMQLRAGAVLCSSWGGSSCIEREREERRYLR